MKLKQKPQRKLKALFSARIDSPIGEILIVTDEKDRLCSLDYRDHRYRTDRFLRRRFGEEGRDYSLAKRPISPPIQEAFDGYFSGDLQAFENLPIRLYGSEFQIEVWHALQTITAGTTVSYGELAAQIGQPKAARAVGRANGANPVGIVVPCHRVIGTNGSLTGFGGGLDRKRWLLIHESAINELQLQSRSIR